MIRHLIPRVDCGRWSGATLTDPSLLREEVRGVSIVIQWLGLLVEIGIGPVRRRS